MFGVKLGAGPFGPSRNLKNKFAIVYVFQNYLLTPYNNLNNVRHKVLIEDESKGGREMYFFNMGAIGTIFGGQIVYATQSPDVHNSSY